MPVPEVLNRSDLSQELGSAQDQPDIFPACGVTRAQSKKYGFDMSESFMGADRFPGVITFKPSSMGKTKIPPKDHLPICHNKPKLPR